MVHDYTDENREGDHICYISNLAKACTHYPEWNITRSLNDIVAEICGSWQRRESRDRGDL